MGVTILKSEDSAELGAKIRWHLKYRQVKEVQYSVCACGDIPLFTAMLIWEFKDDKQNH